MFDPHASQITITDTAILLRGAEAPAPIVDRRIDGRLLVAAPGKKNRWLILDRAVVPAPLAKRISAPSKCNQERIVVPVEDLDAVVAQVEAWVVGGGKEADEAAAAKKAATAAKRAATLKAKADAQAAADRAAAAEKAAAEAKARREAADAARPALVATCQALAAGAIRFVTYPGFDGEFIVRTPYDPRVVEVLRAIPGARWDEARRVWNVSARSHAALGPRIADINAWCAQTTAANAEAARVAEEARGAERAALAARRFIELADRVPALGTTLRRGDRVVVVESYGRTFRTSDDDGLLDPWMEGEWCRYVYHRDATADEIAALEASEPKAAPVMVATPCQQQQSRDLRAGPPEPREIRVTALGHLGYPCDPASDEASLWIVMDGRLSRDCASHQEALDLAEDFRGWGYVVPAMIETPCQQQQACAAPPVPHPAGPPTHGWLDEELRSYVDDVLREIMPVEDAHSLQTVTELEIAETHAYAMTKAWIHIYEQDCALPLSVPFGDVFDARQRLQDAHARVSALTAASV